MRAIAVVILTLIGSAFLALFIFMVKEAGREQPDDEEEHPFGN